MDIWSDIGGFFNTIMSPLYWAVSWVLVGFHSFFSLFLDPNSGVTWALSIILLTMIIRTLLIPLFVRQINSSRNMQLIGPKQRALQEKYGHDRERLGQETMKLYKEEGVNPMASCLPLLLQMPIFLSLFWVLNNASRGVPMGVFVDNPDLMDSLRHATLFGAEISATFWPIAATGWGATQTLTAILVIAMTVVLFITQLQLMRKNMPPEALTGPMAQQQKMMLYLFPFMYLFMGVNIPIGVLLYWLTTNLWNMAQQYILIHNNPAPNTPAYVDWEERMRARGKDPDEIIARRRGKSRRPAATTDYDPTKVARQSSSGASKPTRSSAPASVDDDDDDARRTVVRRQQPRRNSRAQRKTQAPTNPAE
ncbi:MAG: membrane protein insertase YidC [Propionicimonas sp.]